MTTNDALISAAATYFPSCRVARGRKVVVACNGDEDALTLAISAGLALPTQGVSRVFLALGHSPLQAGPLGEVVREALGLPADVLCTTVVEDELGAIAALTSALDAVTLGRHAAALVIAAEAGDGASAIALRIERATAGIAVTSIRSEGAVLYGSWTDAQGTRGHGDRRYLDATHAAPLHRLLEGVAGPLAIAGTIPPELRAGLPPNPISLGGRGITGPLFAIVAAAREGAFSALAIGASRSLLVTGSVLGSIPLPETSAPALPPKAPEASASPRLSLPTSSPFFGRATGELLRLEGARCDACGHAVFPPSQRPICAACGESRFTTYRLPREGKVYTFTVNRFLPTGFGDRMIMVMAELTDGSRFWAPASGIEDVAIGMPVELRLRRFTQDGGVPMYAMKFTPRSAS